MTAQLRPYQATAIERVIAAWQQHNDVLLVMATGAGKTVVFMSLLPMVLGDDKRGLVIAHRKELIEQPLERLRAVAPDWLDSASWPRVGIVMAAHNDVSRQLIIGSVASLNDKRLVEILSYGKISYLVTDECHHSTAASYLRIFAALKEANPDLKHLGVTATPERADGDGLIKVYSTIADQVLIPDLVQQRYLVAMRGIGISVGISLNGVHSRGGDFVPKELSDRFDTAECRQVVVKAYLEHASNRRAIAFTASVAGAHALAQLFQSAGVSAVAIDGTTPKEERGRILSEFRAGRIQVIANCSVLTEGFDAPGTSCILMACPTRSKAKYTQCIGRGLRPANGIAMPGEDCLILDFLPQDDRDIMTLGDVLGMPKPMKQAAKAMADKEQIAGAVQSAFTYDGQEFYGGTALEIVARELHYLDVSPYSWFRRDGYLVLGLGLCRDGNERILVMTSDDPACLYGLLRKVDRNGKRGPWQHRLIASGDAADLGDQAHAIADKWTSTISSKDARWRSEMATEGQIKYLQRLTAAIRNADAAKLSKGEAAQLITYYQAVQALGMEVAA